MEASTEVNISWERHEVHAFLSEKCAGFEEDSEE